MEQDSSGVETDRESSGAETNMEIAHSKEQLLWAKEERRQINEKLEEATLIRKRLEKELKDADMKVQKDERKKERLEWERDERQWRYEGLGCCDTLMVACFIWVVIGSVVSILAAVAHAIRDTR